MMLSRVPIPRMPDRHSGRKTGRTARACDVCRSRKAKCDGHKPTCGQCSNARLVPCIYSEPKRYRQRTELELAKQKTDRYERLLQEIYHEVESPVAEKIGRALVCF